MCEVSTVSGAEKHAIEAAWIMLKRRSKYFVFVLAPQSVSHFLLTKIETATGVRRGLHLAPVQHCDPPRPGRFFGLHPEKEHI